MHALLLTAPSQLEYTEFPDPSPAPDEVLIRIRACGICGSDLHGWDGSSGRRRPPLIMGHEAAGEIAAVGADVEGWAVGDRVTFDSTVYCGKCPRCQRGEINLCEHRRVVGVAPNEYRQHGAFAEYLALPARILYRMPEGMTFEQAALAEPLSIALHALKRARVNCEDTALVVGTGMIGLLVVQALRAAGVPRIVAVDLEASRLELARKLGATDTVLSGRPDTEADVQRATAGGATVAFEVVGITPTIQLAIAGLRPGGTVVLVGNVAREVTFPQQAVVTRELSVLGTCGSAGEYPEALSLLASGAIDTASMIAAVAPLSEGAAWFARLTSREGRGTLKVILSP
jgi:L-iditol 2-dehydrogenase